MAWWSILPGIFGGVGKTVKDVAEVWRPNAEALSKREHAERIALSEQDMASLQQFAAEFIQPSSGWWNGFVNGLNRLPRPMIALAVLFLLVLPPIDPEWALLVFRSYAVVPEGLWILAGVVIAFYFGGRWHVDAKKFTVGEKAAEAASSVAKAKKALEERRTVETEVLANTERPVTETVFVQAADAGLAPAENRVVRRWTELGRPHAGRVRP